MSADPLQEGGHCGVTATPRRGPATL